MFGDAEEFLGEVQGETYAPARSSQHSRAPHPKGFEPGVRLDPGRWLVTSPPLLEELSDDEAWAATVAALKIKVPEGWRVRVTEMRHDPAAWHRDKQGDDAVTRPVWRYRFAVEEAPVGAAGASNIDELAAELTKVRPPARQRIGGEGTFVIAWNDWQLFKAVGDGVQGTVTRIIDSIGASIERALELRTLGRSYPRCLVVASGDIVEGCEIYPHQVWELQGDMRDQVNAARRLIVYGITELAKHFDEVHVLAVGGNHGERRVDGKKTNRHDNTDAAVFEQAQDVIEASERYPHVTFSIPREELAATVMVEGWILATTHGHIAGKGAGGPEAKLKKWYQGQAAGKRPAGDADVLVTSHYHSFRCADWGGCMWLQAPAMDGGSPQFTDLTGEHAEAGLLTFGITERERVRDLEVIAFTPAPLLGA